jgi:hypothetical protein
MKRIFIWISAMLLLSSNVVLAQNSNNSVLRVDFYRCGNFNTDTIKIKEMFLQKNNSIGPK